MTHSTLRTAISVTGGFTLMLLLVATSGDSENEGTYPPNGYVDMARGEFEVPVSESSLELVFDGVGQNRGAPDDRGEFEWRLAVELGDGVGPGRVVLWDCEDETSIEEAVWPADGTDEDVQLRLNQVPEDCYQSSVCEARACVRFGADETAPVRGSWTLSAAGREGLDYTAYVRLGGGS